MDASNAEEYAVTTSCIWSGWKGRKKRLSASIKCDPHKLPVPKLPPTKAVNIGADKMSYVPNIDVKPEKDKKGWTQRDERILAKLKKGGMKDKDIARKMGRTLYSVKWKINVLRGAGQL